MKDHFNKLCLNNAEMIKGEIKGIALYFTGLGHTSQPANDMVAAPECARHNVLYILPFYNPWCWMNEKTVKYVDAMVDAARELFNVSADAPVGVYGGSMGGYNTFHYAVKSKNKIVAAALNCPCCNIEYELPYSPTTVFRSYFESAIEDTDDFEKYAHDNSPINMVDKLPKIPYRFAVGLKDAVLYPSMHSNIMVERMVEAGHDVVRNDFPDVGHCNLTHKDRIAEHTWLCEKIWENVK